MCDTLVVETDDGMLFAKNSDRDPNEPQLIRRHAAADHPAESSVPCTWMSIAQVPHTHAVLLSQPWWMWGAEMGANEHGVTIGNEAVFNRAGTARTGLLGMDLVRLALERADSAAGAVDVIVTLLERFGQGGSCSHDHPGFRYDNSYLIADPDGAVVLETAGRAWATEEVTGRCRSISNGYTIPDFARAHADPVRPLLARGATRRRRTERSGARVQGPGDLFAALRDHGDHAVPRYHRLNGALGAPCAHAGGCATSTQTTASWVADLGDRDRQLHWVTASAAPCTSIFKPIRVDQRPSSDPAGDPSGDTSEATNRFDPSIGWWRHELLHRRVLRDPGASTARFGTTRDRLEAAWLADPPPTSQAFAIAASHTAEWYGDLVAADLVDRRPRWLAAHWRRLDEAAGVPHSLPLSTLAAAGEPGTAELVA